MPGAEKKINMAKLTNDIEFLNIFFPIEYAEYLLSNKFNCIKVSSDTLHFEKGEVHISVKNDTIDVYRWFQATDPEKSQWRFSQSHTGISNLGLFNWIMLMHLMNAQTIAGFLKNTKEEGQQSATEAKFILSSLHHSQLQSVQ